MTNKMKLCLCLNRDSVAFFITGTAEQHCKGLVQLLETCHQFNHKPLSKRSEDPPHAKISADIISCIFLNYNKRAVMELGTSSPPIKQVLKDCFALF